MEFDAYAPMLELAAAQASGRLSSVALTRTYLERIAALDPALHSFAHVFADSAMQAAEAADRLRAAGVVLSPLHGIPIGVKDLVEWEGRPCEAGSSTWQGRLSSETGTLLQRLLAAGMVVVGKTHMVEFAFGGWGTNPSVGAPRNPWGRDVHRVTGGSSSGSGVAVGAALVPAAIGSDTGGSIRIPAAINGIVGLKPTYGRVSLAGCVALSPSLDTNGPMTRTVADAAALLEVLAAPDPRDPATLAAPPLDLSGLTARKVRGMRIAVMREEDFPLEVHPAVMTAFLDAQAILRELGANLYPVKPPRDFRDTAARAGRLIAAEAYALHQAALADVTAPYAPAVRARLEAGRSIDAAAYIAMLEERRAAMHAWQVFMADYEALLTPAVALPAIPLADVDEAQTPMGSFTRPGNYFGACGLALPAGLSDDGLPVGVQLLGRPFGEADILALGLAYEAVVRFHERRPEMMA